MQVRGGAWEVASRNMGCGTSAFGYDYSLGWRITGVREKVLDVEFGVLAVWRGDAQEPGARVEFQARF